MPSSKSTDAEIQGYRGLLVTTTRWANQYIFPLFITCPFLQVGRDPTFESMASRAPCLNRGEFTRAGEFAWRQQP